MGLLDIFKKHDQPSGHEAHQPSPEYSLANFDCYYIYGLTDNPFRQSSDYSSFEKLYRKVIGASGGIAIGSSFHPYKLINSKGTTAWQAAYLQLYAGKIGNEAFNAIRDKNKLFLIDPSKAFMEYVIWPDMRLTASQNPIFKKYVPFVIPFLVYKRSEPTNWETEVEIEMLAAGNASDYLEQITRLSRFMMPEPSFVLGFDKFDESSPSELIDNFIKCKSKLV